VDVGIEFATDRARDHWSEEWPSWALRSSSSTIRSGVRAPSCDILGSWFFHTRLGLDRFAVDGMSGWVSRRGRTSSDLRVADAGLIVGAKHGLRSIDRVDEGRRTSTTSCAIRPLIDPRDSGMADV